MNFWCSYRWNVMALIAKTGRWMDGIIMLLMGMCITYVEHMKLIMKLSNLWTTDADTLEAIAFEKLLYATVNFLDPWSVITKCTIFYMPLYFWNLTFICHCWQSSVSQNVKWLCKYRSVLPCIFPSSSFSSSWPRFSSDLPLLPKSIGIEATPRTYLGVPH